jgi:DNA-binding HxlR family transcriptional regulator
MPAGHDAVPVEPRVFDWAAQDPGNCSIGHATRLFGDRWALLVLRELTFGVDRFETIQAHLAISRRTLADRLDSLLAAGLIERVPYKQPGQRLRHKYSLTAAGADVIPVITALREWGDQHRPDTTPPPVQVVHRDCGQPVELQPHCTAGHGALGWDEVEPAPGPGARPLHRDEG